MYEEGKGTRLATYRASTQHNRYADWLANMCRELLGFMVILFQLQLGGGDTVTNDRCA